MPTGWESYKDSQLQFNRIINFKSCNYEEKGLPW